MKALIIGGGIAGPVTALALRKAGIDSVVFEAYDGTADGVGGILSVAPNGLAALRIVGLDSDFGEPVRRMVMADNRGRVLGSIEGEPSRVVWRPDLYRRLRDLATAQQIKVEHGKRLVDVQTHEDGVVATFSDGSTESGDLLVGADGIRSTVRTIIDPAAPGPEYVGLLGFGSYALNSGVRCDPETMYFVFGSSFLGYWAQPDGTIAWFNNLAVPEPMTTAEIAAVPSSTWMARLREAYGDDMPAKQLLAHSETVIGGLPLEIMPSVPRWHRDRMVLVGDSAHAPSASSGQGASLAAESAVQLARCLRDIRDIPTAFATYERLRRPRVAAIAARAARTNSNKRGIGPITRLLMPLVMKTVGQRAFTRDQNYRIDWDAQVSR
ncbi:FAD-dependent oxidoreductase [Lentzea nigeriaca]|uniref:FAD-dependent oxidoreductase n=1 Tax=Lentzea nigeriaca TaxID=1128665 RepID=UPI0027DD6DC9|nr:NAD(P)/FAD-dependent oxidoreductase [Lentzea nigeriaca]MBM7862862.1 2-polyprenyl-6-methoxyphenol hydroxylase-like FAD-dependent oxidoreductase [Lentzea nigeriaca]